MNDIFLKPQAVTPAAEARHKLTITDSATEQSRCFEMKYPVALAGRAPGSDIHLDEPSISYRHAYFQVIAGEVFCVDLDSRHGICWQEGRHRYGWLTPARPVRIGSHFVRTARPADEIPLVSPEVLAKFNPLEVYRGQFGPLPDVEIEFLETEDNNTVLPVRRVLTFIGSNRKCKIQLNDKHVSNFHCSLFLSPDGLWVIDLLGKGGTFVDGEPVGCQLLQDGCVLKVNRYRMRIKYVAAQSVSIDTEILRSNAEEDSADTDVLIDMRDESAVGSRDTITYAPSDTEIKYLLCDTVIEPEIIDESASGDHCRDEAFVDLARQRELLDLEHAAISETSRQLADERRRLQSERRTFETERAMFDQTQQEMSKALQRLRKELAELQRERDQIAAAPRGEHASTRAELMMEARKLHLDKSDPCIGCQPVPATFQPTTTAV